MILRSKDNQINPAIKVFSDQTPHQIAKFKNLKDELALRMSNGESNLKIKYIKGMPKIVETQPKNSKTQVNSIKTSQA